MKRVSSSSIRLESEELDFRPFAASCLRVERAHWRTIMTTRPPRVLPLNLHGIEAAIINGALDRLESLAVVKDARCDDRMRDGRVICNMWCGATHQNSGEKQPSVPLNKKPSDDPTAVPNYLVAAERLYAKIEREHAGCVAAAKAAKAKATQSGERKYLLRQKMHYTSCTPPWTAD